MACILIGLIISYPQPEKPVVTLKRIFLRLQEEDPLAQAIAKLIKADTDTYLDKFNFRADICMSCDWRSSELDLKATPLCLSVVYQHFWHPPFQLLNPPAKKCFCF